MPSETPPRGFPRPAFLLLVIASLLGGALAGFAGVFRAKLALLALGMSESSWAHIIAPPVEETIKLAAVACVAAPFILKRLRPDAIPVFAAFVGLGYSLAETFLSYGQQDWIPRLVGPLVGHASYSAIASLVFVAPAPRWVRLLAFPTVVGLHTLNNNLPPLIAIPVVLAVGLTAYTALRAAAPRWRSTPPVARAP